MSKRKKKQTVWKEFATVRRQGKMEYKVRGVRNFNYSVAEFWYKIIILEIFRISEWNHSYVLELNYKEFLVILKYLEWK